MAASKQTEAEKIGEGRQIVHRSEIWIICRRNDSVTDF